MLISASLKADVTQVALKWPFAADVLGWLHTWAWVTLPLLVILLGVGQFVRSKIGEPRAWQAIHDLLDQLQKFAFSDRGKDDPPHYHRVTLFRVRHWRLRFVRWPWSRWLIPVERSGHATRRSSVAFRIPDNADKAEGVAGQTWAKDKTFFIDGLPDLNCTSPVEGAREEYAPKTWVTTAWLRKRDKPLARSFCGIPVEVRGKLWGVLVLDSRDEQPIKQRGVTEEYRRFGRFLGTLLERA